MDPQQAKKAPSHLDLTRAGYQGNDVEQLTSSTICPTQFDVPYDAAATKKLVRKMDLHLIPFLALIYLLCFLDRTNVGNAKLAKMEEDLKMSGLKYNHALAILFPFYVLAEIPSNIILKRFRPSTWFTIIMVTWSAIMISMGFVRKYSELLICRSLLGFAEGGLYPGVTYLITIWYKRHECGFRMALFFSAATAAGAFGGLLARGISSMEGIGGYNGWRWIFILEGLLSLCVASSAYWFIHDSPATARFLSPVEKAEVERRLKSDCSSLSEEFDKKYIYQAFKDWKIWVNCVLTVGIFTPLYSISLFMPTIIKNLGYSNNTAQLMTVPPYVTACFCTLVGNWCADKAGQRGIFLIGFQLTAITGLSLLLATDVPHIQYAGTFLATSGIFSLVPLIGAWTANNIGGTLKRAVGIAMQIGFGNLGGVISAYVYQNRDAPRFIRGHAILLGLVTMSLFLTAFMTSYLRYENSRRDALLEEQCSSTEDFTITMKQEEREKGDDAIFYRYTV
ncbi:hypothetical protein HYALB_00011636 [Hymenoscyphus albidus]|uniref:Major facilitator superfamily (MFS) profile domain-containing protein n=1 Tax=Hymenoscyphus albidus TaxID=595503 RepID=A0A9N9LKZ1_9HELO|nr:hypothetical protein HYALB_00011636 [Hymenoscyphus albidus]